MLTRIGEGLYWMGRYVKRSEHLARYLRVQYFSTLNVEMANSKDFTLRSIMNMAGMEIDQDVEINEENVLELVGFDATNPSSIFSTVRNARENARSMQHVFSTELWESINKYYLFIKDYDIEVFKTRGLYDFTIRSVEYVKIIQSNIYTTLITNDEYYFTLLGLHLENLIQVNRILKSKVVDTEILSHNGEITPMRQYQWITTLRALESLDMHNRYNKNHIDLCTISEFLIKNPAFPRSYYVILQHVLSTLQNISIRPAGYTELEYHVAKIESKARFYTCTDITHLNEFLNDMTLSLDFIHELCSSIYFNAQN